ncbi:unnamed protein product, partial [Mesorhabditis belari]|uniref:Uncharacterized protein n=1 Tax=Mesorhabditis belari TaxID=2138241 RepID=A0AAF3J5A1_9BILA
MDEILEKPPKRRTPLNNVFYTEIFFALFTLVLGSLALLISRPPLFLWLPSVFLLLGTTISLSSLVYLNRGLSHQGSSNLMLYSLISLVLIIFRLMCCSLLLLALFSPHSHPPITIPLFGITVLHVFFGFFAIGKTTAFRSQIDKKRKAAKNNGIEEIQVSNLTSNYNLIAQSNATLFTNIDEHDEYLIS